MYIKIDDNTWIFYEGETATVIKKDELQAELERAQQKLSEIPAEPTDAELLDWARINYPRMNYSVEKNTLEEFITKNTSILNNLV
jgi:hypothetical protein